MSNEIRFVGIDEWTMAVVVTGVNTFAKPQELRDAVSLKFESDCTVLHRGPMDPMAVAFYIRAGSAREVERLTSVDSDFEDLINRLDLAECAM